MFVYFNSLDCRRVLSISEYIFNFVSHFLCILLPLLLFHPSLSLTIYLLWQKKEEC